MGFGGSIIFFYCLEGQCKGETEPHVHYIPLVCIAAVRLSYDPLMLNGVVLRVLCCSLLVSFVYLTFADIAEEF